MGKPHALVVPFPGQGHVIPSMELSYRLIDHGFKITFLNTDFIHDRVLAALPKMSSENEQIHLVSIPDGMAPGEDRNDLSKLCDCSSSLMPGYLEELIYKLNGSDEDDKITCVIADASMPWAVQVAEKMGIQAALFLPASVKLMALIFHIPTLIETGIIDENGFPSKQQMIKLSPTMPEINIDELHWLSFGDRESQKSMFQHAYHLCHVGKSIKWIICNSFYDIEQSAFSLVPNALPIGPLLAGSRFEKLEGNFWPEDSTCLNWLDKQPLCSVIYVAFGSVTVFDRHQFHELALGLELSDRPFLWVVRPDLTDGPSEAYPAGFKDRVVDRGLMVGWSPQRRVLGHPSIACFLTHCGWNSTMEGLSNGVPFLSWPSFGDQLLNQTYISDVWKVGLRLKADGTGIISKEEIKEKIKELLGDERIRRRSSEFKEMARKSVTEGGSSTKNFKEFVEAMKC